MTPAEIKALVERLEAHAQEGFEHPKADALMIEAATALRSFMDGGWRTIETAPRDGRKILIWSEVYRPGHPVIVWWDDDRFAKKPLPRWLTRDPIYGRRAFIDRPPTHWMPLPTPPAVEGE